MGFVSERIREREEAKTLDLLAFAMDRAGVPRGAWAAAVSRAALPPVDDCLCLYREGEAWALSYSERGGWREIARFPLCHDAIEFLFWQMTNAPTPYSYREAWEAHSGQEFSLVE
jgi:hypothetical protein